MRCRHPHLPQMQSADMYGERREGGRVSSRAERGKAPTAMDKGGRDGNWKETQGEKRRRRKRSERDKKGLIAGKKREKAP